MTHETNWNYKRNRVLIERDEAKKPSRQRQGKVRDTGSMSRQFAQAEQEGFRAAAWRPEGEEGGQAKRSRKGKERARPAPPKWKPIKQSHPNPRRHHTAEDWDALAATLPRPDREAYDADIEALMLEDKELKTEAAPPKGTPGWASVSRRTKIKKTTERGIAMAAPKGRRDHDIDEILMHVAMTAEQATDPDKFESAMGNFVNLVVLNWSRRREHEADIF